MNIRPLNAVLACIAVAAVVIPVATYFGTDKGSVFVSGVGALGQVIVAVLLYFLTREQLNHARSEAAYRRGEQQLAKLERTLADMERAHVGYGNAKTGMGRTKFDRDQLSRLAGLKDDIRAVFAQPASSQFNKLYDHAAAASAHDVGSPDYLKHIDAFRDLQGPFYAEIRGQIDAKQAAIADQLRRLQAHTG